MFMTVLLIQAVIDHNACWITLQNSKKTAAEHLESSLQPLS